MKLTQEVIEIIRDRNKLRIRNRLALELDYSQQSIENWLSENEHDGKLTTATALKIISEETGLTQDQILMESESVQK